MADVININYPRKGTHALFRYMGMLSALFAILQSIILIILALVGIACYNVNCSVDKNHSVAFMFHYLYISSKEYKYVNYMSPGGLNFILFLCCIAYSTWILCSGLLYKELHYWVDQENITDLARQWVITTYLICLFDFIIFIFFFVEFVLIAKYGHVEITALETLPYDQDYRDYIDDYFTSQPFKTNAKVQSTSEKDAVGDELFFEEHDYHLDVVNKTVFSSDMIWWSAAPSAIIMSLALKGYVGWIVNLVAASCMTYLLKERYVFDFKHILEQYR